VTADSLVYVYAVLPHAIATDARGINGQPVKWVSGDGLAAAVSAVPATEFEQEPLNAKVGDLGWLGPRALAHQEVNARLFESIDAIVPLAFGTVFRDEDRVRQMLVEQRESLNTRLEAVRGCAEWVIALHLLQEPDAAQATAVQSLRGEIDASSPGRAHLLARKLASLERDEARRIVADAADAVLRAVREIATDVYVEPLPSDTVERPLLRASVLVPRDGESMFMDGIDRLRQTWPEPTYRLLLTGPWPPYRFGGLAEPRD
jgi:hypothetical protein